MARPTAEQTLWKTLKELPYSQTGINENGAIRMVKVGQPICAECQNEFRSGRGWWNICADRGHDPYFTTTEKVEKIPVIEEQDDGTRLIVGEKQVVNTTKKPNIKQAAINERINSGRGLELGQTNKGWKLLPDMGYRPVCEMRNCQAPVAVKTSYGMYCSDRHARLIAADSEGLALPVDNPRNKDRALKRINLDG